MQVIVKERALESLIAKLIKEDRSFHTKNVNELEKAAPPILPQSEMAQQLSTTKMPVEDNEFVPTNKNELGKAAMQLTNQVEDAYIKKFYENFKQLIKKYKDNEAQLKEARLPSFLGAPEEEPVPKDRRARRAARLAATEPEQAYIPSTPAEDAEDIAATLPPRATRVRQPETEKRKKSEKKSRTAVLSDPGAQLDPVAEYLKSLYEPRPRPEWMKNVQMNLSDMAVGDANKLLTAIIKKMGEENVTVDSLEAAAMDAINNLTFSMDGDYIVFTSPEYKVTFRYNTEGNPQNMFSLEQYQETLRGLTSQKSAGVGSQESWGPKYAAALKSMQYAKGDKALEEALLASLTQVQETLTDAVLNSYPPGTQEFNTQEVADKLDIVNDQVVDAFNSAGIRAGLNTVTVDIFGEPVEVSINIPNTPTALQAIEDARFGGVLLALLSATPDELRAYIGKKRRKLRSAVPMDRGMQNFFYDMGMKLGGAGFKMSAEEFQTRFNAAQEIAEEAGLELSDEDIANMILLKGDILDINQIEILGLVKEEIYNLFSNYLHGNTALIKKFGKDALLYAFPEDLSQLRPAFVEIFEDFSDNIIKAFTDKSVSNRLFNIYDNIVDDPRTKAYFKETAGVKHSQIYDQPPQPKRRAKDVSNLAGNLRHISEYMKLNLKSVKASKEKDRMMRAAEELVDPEAIASTLQLFFKTAKRQDVHPAAQKAVDSAAKKVLSIDPSLFPSAERDEARSAARAAASLSPAEMPPEAPIPEPAADVAPEQPSDPNAINKAYDNIIAAYTSASDAKKEKMFDDFEETILLGEPSVFQLRDYPALKTAADYKVLLDKLKQLNESASRSLLISLIHGYTRR